MYVHYHQQRHLATIAVFPANCLTRESVITGTISSEVMRSNKGLTEDGWQGLYDRMAGTMEVRLLGCGKEKEGRM